ncbi:uroporphyrinogen-III synthase [Parablastomonas sp. CN1-191]|uniref:uroporphyrinogen-III synthase n=1 Tax=Parablastomonas sp. CN1-191 TaxID=3400908 RepID=UPI003BF89791
MTAPLAIIRPEPGWRASAAAARALGLDVIGAPLFAVSPAAWEVPDAATIDAVVLGSANALRYGGDGLAGLRALPAYAVGAATAAAARAAGFRVVAAGADDLQALAGTIDPAHRRLLRLSGRDRGSFTPPPGTMVIDRTVYAAETLPLPRDFAAALRDRAVIALHSPRAARHFAAECDRIGIDRSRHAVAALAGRVAAAVGHGWDAARVADVPTDAALLALAAEMCKTARPNTNKSPGP